MGVRGPNRPRKGCSDALEGSHLVTKLCLCGGQKEGDLTIDYCSPRLISTRGPLPSASRWTAAITKVDLLPIPQANRHKIAREERGRYSKDTFCMRGTKGACRGIFEVFFPMCLVSTPQGLSPSA